MANLLIGLAVILAVGSVLYGRKKDATPQLRGDYSGVFSSPVAIICGECAGEGVKPRRTLLNASGTGCASCGSPYYELVSTMAVRQLAGGAD